MLFVEIPSREYFGLVGLFRGVLLHKIARSLSSSIVAVWVRFIPSSSNPSDGPPSCTNMASAFRYVCDCERV